MAEKEKSVVEGWQVSTEEVRKLATKVGVPIDVSVPEVIIVGKGESRDYQKGPQIHKDTSGESPSGYFVTIPESMLEETSGTNYVLGFRTEQNIRHELAHYLDYMEPGASVGRDVDPYIQAVKEVKADLRGGVRNLPLALSRQALNLRDDYGLPDRKAFEMIAKAADSLGISRRTVVRARRIYGDMINE